MRIKIVIGAIFAIVALTGCEPNELYPAGGIPFGGSNSGSYTAPAPAQNLAPMLQDPEGKLSDDSATIYAESLDVALNKCQQTANNLSDQNTIVSCLGCKLMTSAKAGRYACTYRTETRQP